MASSNSPRKNPALWRDSTLSEGPTVVGEASSEPEEVYHDAPDLEKERTIRSQASRGTVRINHHQRNLSREGDAISVASEPIARRDLEVPQVRRERSGSLLSQYITRQPSHGVFRHANPTTNTVFSESKSLTTKVTLGDHLSIILGPPVIILLDLAVPLAIYYSWLTVSRRKWREGGEVGEKPMYNEKILGLTVVSFGFGEIYILLARVVRLIKDEECRPLLSNHWWELDATSWVYLTALLIALIPYVVSSSSRPVIPWLYIQAPGFLMGFLGLLMLVSLIPFKVPVKINSEPAGHKMRPLMYYAAEDFFAVDHFQQRSFRRHFKQRYDSSEPYRKLMRDLTMFWIVGICLFNGMLAVLWTNLTFEYAFGPSLVVLFGWIGTWALITRYWARKIVVGGKMAAREEKQKRLSALVEMDEERLDELRHIQTPGVGGS